MPSVSEHRRYTAEQLANMPEDGQLRELVNGVRAVLNVDPENRTVGLCRSPNQIQIMDESDQIVVDDIVPGWQLNIAELFG